MTHSAVFDFGSHSLKGSLFNHDWTPINKLILPNCILRSGTDELFGKAIPDTLSRLNLTINKLPRSPLDCAGLSECNSVANIPTRRDLLVHLPRFNEGTVQWPAQRSILDGFLERLGLLNMEENIGPELQCILCEPSLTPVAVTAAFLSHLLETSRPETVGIVPAPLAILTAQGVLTGVALDVGNRSSRASIVIDGGIMPGACQKIDLGGHTITDRLITSLQIERGYVLPSPHKYFLGEVLKQRYCFVATDYRFQKSLTSATDNGMLKNVGTKLPDGASVWIGSERYETCEILWGRDSLIAKEEQQRVSLQRVVVNALMSKDIMERSILMDCIVAAGSTCNLMGFKGRFQTEVGSEYVGRQNNLAGTKGVTKHPVVYVANDSGCATLRGASIMGQVMAGQGKNSFWRSRAECEELGYERVVQDIRARING